METKITKENLVKYGFTDNTVGAKDNSWFPDYMTKDLISEEWRKEHAGTEENEDAVLCLVVTGERNIQEFALRTGDGTLYLGFESIEHLEAFEKAIGSYSPNY